MKHSFEKIPTYDNGIWTVTEFTTRDDFRDFLLPLFKEPGKYAFPLKGEIGYGVMTEQAATFQQKKLYTEALRGSTAAMEYWEDQKRKIRRGVIYKIGEKTWYFPGTYYGWINFLQIPHKEGHVDFPLLWDTHLHIALYNTLAFLHHCHSIILKKRQIGSSLYHAADLVFGLWFESSQNFLMGASKSSYTEKTWKIFESYRNFLIQHTEWIRYFTPDTKTKWQQRREVKVDNRKVFIGNHSVLASTTFDQSPFAGVGGAMKKFFYEEAGIAPTLNDTYEVIVPALKSGATLTGHFIAAGAVGNLDDCRPLKNMLLNPKAFGFYAVNTTLYDETNTYRETGLFIPVQWSYPPYIDSGGNSMVEEALEYIKKTRAEQKKALSGDVAQLQLRISQDPINIAEAFAVRSVSVFPHRYTVKQMQRIDDDTYPTRYIDLERTATGFVEKQSGRNPVEYPVDMKATDKRGCIAIYKSPPKDVPWGIFYASIDPVDVGITVTSDSLACIYIYETAVEIIDEDGKSTIEGDRIAATWCGRYDDIQDTNEELSKLVEYYNAWTICENNKTSFINYMIAKNRRQYLAPSSAMLFDRDLGIQQSYHQPYGWTKTNKNWDRIKEYGINFLSEELMTIEKNDKTIYTKYGVERIPDPLLLKEMQNYEEAKGKNFDRVIAFCALVAFIKIQKAGMGMRKAITRKADHLENLAKYRTLSKEQNPFNNIGKGSNPTIKRSNNPFKYLK